MPKKILIYAPVVGRGGVTRVLEKLSNHWIKSGHQVSFLGSPLNEIHHAIKFNQDVKLIQLEGGQAPKHPNLTGFLTKNRVIHQRHLLRLQNLHDAVFFPHPWQTMRIWPWTYDGNYIAFIPDFAHDYISGIVTDKILVDVRRECFNFAKYCSSIVFASEFQQQWGYEKYGMTQGVLIQKPGFIPENFDISETNIERFKKKYQIKGSYLLAMHVYGHKDPSTLIRGYVAAKTMFPELPPLVIGGIHSELFDPRTSTKDVHARMIQGLITSSGIDWTKDLRFLGYVPEELLGGVYAGATMTIITSKSEGGISGTICESAAAKTPIIYSDIPAHTEVFGDQANGPCGICFQTENSAELALAICRAMHKYDHFLVTGSNLYSKVGRDNWDEVAQHYIDLF